jgi:uncharacterized membrane protein
MRHARFLVLVAVVAGPRLAAGDEPPTKLTVISPKDEGIMATGINGRGDVVGFEWVEKEELPGQIVQAPFFARGEEVTYLPLLEGYTATFPAAVSDDGLVVGRAGKPAPLGVRVPMRNQAFWWDAESGIHGLGVLDDDWASFATGVTRDGRRISGFSVGENRVRACVWDRQGDGWRATALPHAAGLASNVVAISGDGRYVAAVDGGTPCLWTRDDSGEWTREVIGEFASLIPRAVNDQPTVVGLRHDPQGRTHAVIWTRERGCEALEEPEGFNGSEANAVNNAGVVVGMVDGPHGSDVGPQAFAYERGAIRLIGAEGPRLLGIATAINDRGEVTGVVEKEEEEEPAKPDAREPAKPDPADPEPPAGAGAP